MDTIERYHTAVGQLLERGQSQEMLLRIVQAKMSERVNSYAVQLIRTRKLFEVSQVDLFNFFLLFACCLYLL